MSKYKTVNNTVFAGQPVLRRGNGSKLKFKVIASGTQTDTVKGVIAYSVATTKCYITVNTAGTGTLLGLGL